ncbi:hypothetical protein [Acrocarpospora phusangensis]|uniref:hypothetical protein n=1 Tax=Acrocarpospora phusangensis TaxID=1070424 RepID=UPI001951389C|nr:hypothetical protein [Acrocarpospora phusangensis]
MAVVAAVVVGVVVPAAPALAIPKDCSLTVVLINAPSALNARGSVYCTRPETYWVETVIYRHDSLGRKVKVAEGETKYNGHQGWGYAHASEPCSDVQTNKNYSARAFLYDARLVYPIEVKDATSSTVRGHC